jgi:hypothetical protein
MKQPDLAVIATNIAADTRRQIAEAIAPLLARLAVLEARKPEKGDPGRDGRDGKDGRDGIGKDGQDGLTADDIELVQDGRNVAVKARATGRIIGRLSFPIPVYAGVWKEGTTYQPGDMVTHGGSLWHANEATAAKPGEGPYTLCVKRGRDGRDAPREGT